MQLIRIYAKEFPDDPPITTMDVIHRIRVPKRMEFRVCWMMPVASAEAPPFWTTSFRWSIPVRDPNSKNKGLNTVEYFDSKAFLSNTEALSTAAWNGHADPKPDGIAHKTVRRSRTGISVP